MYSCRKVGGGVRCTVAERWVAVTFTRLRADGRLGHVAVRGLVEAAYVVPFPIGGSRATLSRR